MNVIVDGQNRGILQVIPTTTIKDLKEYFRNHFNEHTIHKLTFNNGSELPSAVWVDNMYDDVDFHGQANMITGGVIELIPTPTMPTMPPVPTITTINLKIPGIPRGTISPVPMTPVITIMPPQPAPRTTREQRIQYIYNRIMRVMDDYSYNRVMGFGEYERFIRDFPTYDIFQRKQLERLTALNDKELNFFEVLTEKYNNRLVDYMDLEGGEPGMSPGGVILLENGEIVVVAER